MFIILFLSCFSGFLAAQGVSVGLEVLPDISSRDASSDVPSDALQAILRTTMTLALEDRGFLVIQYSSTDAPPSRSEFFLVARYAITAGRVTLRMILTDARSGLTMESVGLERTLDPQFDREVTRLVGTVLQAAERELAARPRSAAPEAVPEREIPEGAANRPEPPETQPDRQPAEVAEAIPPKPEQRSAADVRVGAGVFLPFGAASDYFRAAVRFEAEWLFPSGPSGRFRGGWSVGVTAISLEAVGAPGGDTVFVHSGIGAEYSFIRKKLIGLDFSVQAGPALVLVSGGGVPPVQKLLPFVQAGTAAGYRPSPRWEFGFSAAVQVLLDYGETFFPLRTVWGLAPALTVTRELK